MNCKSAQRFIEKHNITFLYLILANEELKRLSKLPYSVKQQFDKKITTMALKHAAEGDIPDYFVPEEEKPDDKITEIIDGA